MVYSSNFESYKCKEYFKLAANDYNVTGKYLVGKVTALTVAYIHN